ncbi:MAG: PAS domain-containing protein [Gammaproteobacteria bacterium]|nr:PAS domain-containing protein [Gammaproteobacteria bacterium]
MAHIRGVVVSNGDNRIIADAWLGENLSRIQAMRKIIHESLQPWPEERFELAVNGSNDAIWDWDIQSNRLYLSPRYRKLLGYEANELPGMFTAWARLIHPNDRVRVMKAIKDHVDYSKPYRCEHRLKTRRGDWLWMLGRGEAVRDKSGAAIRMAGSYTDISESVG